MANVPLTSFVSTSELLMELGMSRKTLQRWARELGIPKRIHLRTGRRMFTEDEASAIMARRDRMVVLDAA